MRRKGGIGGVRQGEEQTERETDRLLKERRPLSEVRGRDNKLKIALSGLVQR